MATLDQSYYQTSSIQYATHNITKRPQKWYLKTTGTRIAHKHVSILKDINLKSLHVWLEVSKLQDMKAYFEIHEIYRKRFQKNREGHF